MKFDAYDFIRDREGLELDAYQDGGGVWTIGYGHTKDVKKGDIISLEVARSLLDGDLADAERAVNTMVRVPLNQNQYNALVSLVFNIGSGSFSSSTALSRLNAKNYVGAAEAMTWWNKDQNPKTGKLEVIPGLVTRRALEKALFNTPVVSTITVDEQVKTLMAEYTQKLMEIFNARN